jgi:hypothetical protein
LAHECRTNEGEDARLPILQYSRGHVQGFFQLLLAESEPLSRLEWGEVVTFTSVWSSAGQDVPRFHKLPQLRPIEGSLSLGELPRSCHRSNSECEILRMGRRVDQHLRHSAMSQRNQRVLNRRVLFRVGEIQNAHSGLDRRVLYCRQIIAVGLLPNPERNNSICRAARIGCGACLLLRLAFLG